MKSKFTKDNQDTIIDLMRAGNHKTVAAQSVGIDYRTLARWLADGKEEDSKYYEFAQRVLMAEAEFETAAVASITANQNPKYLLEVLSRKNPNRWASTSKVQLLTEQKIEHFMDFLCDNLSEDPEILAKVLEIASKYEDLESPEE
jgi:predicted TPR repeat methyltransferase